jgi:hypothetical protein
MSSQPLEVLLSLHLPGLPNVLVARPLPPPVPTMEEAEVPAQGAAVKLRTPSRSAEPLGCCHRQAGGGNSYPLAQACKLLEQEVAHSPKWLLLPIPPTLEY